MPKETFLRLPEEKRNRFMDAAWKEFLRTPFVSASINQIVRRAGIPRGSFYQYFTDKEELFVYLMKDVQQSMARTYAQQLRSVGGDLFRVQVLSYDALTDPQSGKDRGLDRCLSILRINPGLDLQKMMVGRPGRELMEAVCREIDTSGFRRKDPVFVQQAFTLSIMALGPAVMDALAHPERRAENRAE